MKGRNSGFHPKSNKPIADPKDYRPISLFCVPFKILDRLIYARVKPIIDSLLPRGQAGFLCGRSTVDQVTLLTQEIEDSVSDKKKAGAGFVNLTATYNTVWYCMVLYGTVWYCMVLYGTAASPASYFIFFRQAHDFIHHGTCL